MTSRALATADEMASAGVRTGNDRPAVALGPRRARPVTMETGTDSRIHAPRAIRTRTDTRMTSFCPACDDSVISVRSERFHALRADRQDEPVPPVTAAMVAAGRTLGEPRLDDG